MRKQREGALSDGRPERWRTRRAGVTAAPAGFTAGPPPAGLTPGPWPAGFGLVLTLALAVLLAAAAVGCGGTAAVDTNEPNDGLTTATPLVAGTPLSGALPAGDLDMFTSEVPAGAGDHPFVVTLTCDDPASVEMDVGASLPGVGEGITWPGWTPVVTGDGLEVAAGLRKGTVIVVLRSGSDVAYTLAIDWR